MVKFLKNIAAALTGGWSLSIVSYPIIRLLYGVPYYLERGLANVNTNASTTLGFSVFVGMGLGVAFLRKRRWYSLVAICVISMILFFILDEIYRILV